MLLSTSQVPLPHDRDTENTKLMILCYTLRSLVPNLGGSSSVFGICVSCRVRNLTPGELGCLFCIHTRASAGSRSRSNFLYLLGTSISYLCITPPKIISFEWISLLEFTCDTGYTATPVLSPESKEKLDVKRLLKYCTFDSLVLDFFLLSIFHRNHSE